MKIALFSDVHGHLRMLLHLIRNWQIAHSEVLDAALIAGDLGYFPDPSKFDKATKRWLDRDPEEAGFSKYFTTPLADVERLFEPEFGQFSAVRCPILFVAGNHEDYEQLKSASRQTPAPHAPQGTFPVDCYKRFHCINNGAVVNITGENSTTLRIAGIWGIENARAGAAYKINPAAIKQLSALGERRFDLLLTHDAPAEGYPSGGSALITNVIKTCRPNIHLFGHVHPINDRHEFSVPHTGTKSFILRDVSFGKGGLLGSMGILQWNGSDSEVRIVEDEWLKQMRLKNWEQVLPLHE